MNTLLPFMTYCVLMSSTPGPNNMLLVANGAHYGYRRTVPAILGINLGGLVLTFVCCMGLGALFVAWPALHTTLKLTGTLYMLVLAWKLGGASVAQDRAPQQLGFAQGALFQLVNPKSWIKSVTIASVFMPTGLGLLEASLLLSVVSAVLGFPCVSMWALFGSWIGRFLSNPLRQRAFNVIMAGTLAVLAGLMMR